MEVDQRRWWQAAQWTKVKGQISVALGELLTVIRDLLLMVQTQLTAATTRLENAATVQPCGVGALTSQVLEREMLEPV